MRIKRAFGLEKKPVDTADADAKKRADESHAKLRDATQELSTSICTLVEQLRGEHPVTNGHD